MKSTVYLNGRILPASRAAIPIDDHGFLYGDGAYETLRVYGGRPFRFDAHMRRLSRSLRALRLKTPPSVAVLRDAVLKIVDSNRLFESVVRITVTRGPGPRGLDPRACPTPTVLVTATALPTLDPAIYEKGVTAVVSTVRRNDPAATPPSIKSISCLNGVLAKMDAIDRKAFEAILLTADGAVAEGTVTNVFVVKRNSVLTPKLDGTLLAGVTRDEVVALARRAGHPVRERRLTTLDLIRADEIFLTSTVMEIVPVSRLVLQTPRVRSVTIGGGRPGPVTLDLRARYRAVTRPR